MIRKILGTATFISGSLITLYWHHGELTRIKDRIADTNIATNTAHYLLVHAARGRYNSPQAFELMKMDAKIYRTAIALREIESD